MSVIFFYCPEAPTRCEPKPCDSPAFGIACEPESRCGFCEDGRMWDVVPEAPDAGSVDREVLTLLGLADRDDLLFGEIGPSGIPAVLRRIVKVLALPRPHRRLERLKELRSLLLYASEHGYKVAWAGLADPSTQRQPDLDDGTACRA